MDCLWYIAISSRVLPCDAFSIFWFLFSVAKPKAKKPRLVRTNFLDSDSNSEEEIEEAKE